MIRAVLFVLLLAPVAAAEDVIAPLAKGQAAPFAGQLFDTPTAIRWGLALQRAEDQTSALIDKEKGICRAQLVYKDEFLRIQLEKDDKIIDDLTQRMLKTDSARVKLQYELDHPPWYTSIWFGFGVGVITTTTLVFVGSQAF